MKLTKKTIICIFILIIIIIIYYFYKKDNKSLNINEIELNKEISNEKEQEKINKIIVYITGAIKNEGIYELEENSRIADLIDISGGLAEDANIRNINLALKIEDGDKVYIPHNGDNETENNSNEYMENKNNSENNKNNEITTKNKLNINTATKADLERLPGIGSVTASRIIEYRTQKGKFKKIEDIKNVNGIGNSKFLKIKDLIMV